MQTLIATKLKIDKDLTWETIPIMDEQANKSGASFSDCSIKGIDEKIFLLDILILIMPGLTGSIKDPYIN